MKVLKSGIILLRMLLVVNRSLAHYILGSNTRLNKRHTQYIQLIDQLSKNRYSYLDVECSFRLFVQSLFDSFDS
jgi:hypothetical protein